MMTELKEVLAELIGKDQDYPHYPRDTVMMWDNEANTIKSGVVYDTNTISPYSNTTVPNYIGPPVNYTIIPDDFVLQVRRLIHLLEVYGPKLALLADVMGAMNLKEEDERR